MEFEKEKEGYKILILAAMHMASNNAVFRECKEYNKISKNNANGGSVNFWNVGFREGAPLTSEKKEPETMTKIQEPQEKKKRKRPRPYVRRAYEKRVWYGEGRKYCKIVKIKEKRINFDLDDEFPVVSHDVE